MNKRLLKLVVLVISVSLLLTACGGSQPAAPAAPAKPAVKDTVIVAQGADAYTMDPAKHSVYPTASILFQIYDPLVTRGDDGSIKPALALSWTNPNPTTWQFKLRQGVKFHNGEEFDANAVKFTFDRALDPKFAAPYRSRIEMITKVEVVDKYTVNIITKEPSPTMLQNLNEAAFPTLIVPPKYTAEKGNDVLAKQPVGTGPFKFVEWVKDDHVTLQANADYWGGKPKVNKVIFRPIPETRTRIAELKSGNIDIADNIPPEEVAGLNQGKTKAVTTASDFVYFIAMDTSRGGPLADKRVRQALNYAVDVDAIQKNIMGGMGTRISLTLPANAFGYDASVKPYPYDVEKAKSLLAAAGYKNGFTIPFISRNGRYLKDKEIVEAISGYLAKVNIKCEIQLVEAGVWGTISEKHERKGLSFPGWSGLDADLVWYPILSTGQYQSYYSNKQLDKLLLDARTIVDQNKRAELYKQAAAIIKEEAPHIPMFQPPLIYGVNASLNWVARGDSIIDLRKAELK
jgi:peptide/nickel transport system substrate-binding protein